MERAFLALIVGLGLVISVVSHRPRTATIPATASTTIIVDHSGTATPVGMTPAEPLADSSDGAVELQREPDGHFYAQVEINGVPVRMMVDTGATEVNLSRDDARSAGVATSIGMPDVVGQGADGPVHGEIVELDHVALGSRTLDAVPAVVLDSGQISLLGQSVLSKYSMTVDGETMRLR